MLEHQDIMAMVDVHTGEVEEVPIKADTQDVLPEVEAEAQQQGQSSRKDNIECKDKFIEDKIKVGDCRSYVHSPI